MPTIRLLLLSALALVTAVGLSACKGSAKSAKAKSGAASVRPRAFRVVWGARVDPRAVAVAAAEGGVWVASAAQPAAKDGRLLRLDPLTGKRIASIPVGWWPSSVAVGAGGVWVADSIGDGSRLKNHLPGLENTVTRIDARANRVAATIRMAYVDSVAVGYGAVWATTLAGNAEMLKRIDPRLNRVVATLRLPGASGPLAVGGRRIWALTWFADPTQHARIYEIDPHSNRVVSSLSVPQAGPLSSLVYRQHVLWVSMVNPAPQSPLHGRVVRIDVQRRHQVGRAALVPAATALAVNQAGVWAAGNGSLVSLDVESGQVTRRVNLPGEVPSTPAAIAAAGRTLWLIAGSRVLAGRS